jgi:hypothetical protein
MELTLETPPNNTDDLVSAASYFAHDALAQCADVSVMAFPIGHKPPTEEMLAAVASILRNLVFGIENEILNREQNKQPTLPLSWSILMQSGFLRDPGLIDFALAMFANAKLNSHIAARGSTRAFDQLPALLLVDSNPMLSSAAQALLASETQIRRSPEHIYQQLSPELLHRITWRIVAVLQVINGEKHIGHISRSKDFLADQNETTSLRASARKIVYFCHQSQKAIPFKPAETGVAIFAAMIESATGLDHDHVLRLLDSHSSAPLALMLRACAVTRETAMEVICLIKGFDLTPLEINHIERHFDCLAISSAKAELHKWSAERLRQLSSLDIENGSG